MRRRIAVFLAIVTASLASAGAATAGFSDGVDGCTALVHSQHAGFSDGGDGDAQ